MSDESKIDEYLPGSLDTDERRLDPFPWYETMRENDPVRYDEDRGCWDVFRYDDVKRVLSDHETFSSAGASDFDPIDPEGTLGTTLLDVDPPEHDRFRDVVDEYFEPGNLRKLRPSIRSMVDNQLDRALADGPDVEVIPDVAAPVTVLTISHLLGLSADQRDAFRQFSASMNTGEVDLAQTFEMMCEYFDGLLQDRREDPQDDLLSVIADPETPLSEEERTSFCIVLFLAGHETTTHAIGNAFWTLYEQGLYEAVRDGDLDWDRTFDELLRYRPPIDSVSGRRTTEEVELNGTVIPAGERVTSWVTSANRDPRKFDDPEQFDPERKPNPHLAFGAGPHYCLGSPLGKLECEVIFEAITDRVETIELDTEELVPNPSATTYGLKRLPMRLDAR